MQIQNTLYPWAMNELTLSSQYWLALGWKKSGKAVIPGHTLPVKVFPLLSYNV